VLLPLTPEMNRVTLRLHFTLENEVETPIDLRYQASLVQLDHTVLERPVDVRFKRPGTESVDVGPMQIPYPAEYAFLLVEVGDLGNVPQIRLDVVTNVETPARTIIWTGLALLIVAFAVVLRDAIRAARGHHTR
jgi:hypothetical protein